VAPLPRGATGADTRAILLHEINATITTVRERSNPKEPISDPLPGEPPSAFQMVRGIIAKVSLPPQEKANSGVVPG